MNCQLRSAAPSDAPFLREMLYLALFVPLGKLPFPQSVVSDPAIARYVDGWGTRDGDAGLIALVHDVPAGAAWLRYFPVSSLGYGYVDEKTPRPLRCILLTGAGELAPCSWNGYWRACLQYR